jgi:hypothetical protein
MPIQNPFIVESPSLENLFRDKDSGLPLSNGVVKWFKDSGGRNELKDIYQQVRQPDGTYTYVTLPNPLTLSSIGTYSDNDGNDINIYLWPYVGAPTDLNLGVEEKYFIEVYSAPPPISNSALQFTRENWPPNSSGSNPSDFFEGSENQLANPQFVEVLFQPDVGVSTHTFAVSGIMSTLIAPDWYIDTFETGTVIVEQISDVDPSATSNPPYALSINSTGVSSLTLRQRIVHSPRLFSTDFVSASLQAASEDASPITLNMSLFVSSSSIPIEFFSQNTLDSGAFKTLSDTKNISILNTDPATTGYIDITVGIPGARKLQITSLQIIQVQSLQPATQFLQESTPRQIDHLFHYYKPELEYKPIPSYLVGWDFPLNPTQPLGPTVTAFATGANKSNYVWDQTIVFQATNSGLTYSRSTTTNGFKITGAIASQFAVIQYLEAAQAREILSQRNAVSLKGAISTGTIQGYVNLYWTTDSALPDLKSANYNSLVVSLAAGVPTVGSGGLNGTWAKVPRDNLGDANFLLNTTNANFDFSGWDATATSGGTTATYVAIVVSFASLSVASAVTLDYVSLVGGDIATRPAPKTPDAVLGECEFYYEKSYDNLSAPGTVTNDGLQIRPQSIDLYDSGATIRNFRSAPFSLPFQNEKRKAPTSAYVAFYAPGIATINNALIEIYNAGIPAASANVTFNTNWTLLSGSTKSLLYVPANANNLVATAPISPDGISSSIWFQYIIDTRLGILL